MKQLCFKKNNACASVGVATFFLKLFSNIGVTQQNTTVTKDSFLLNDSHFHLTNYVQEGTDTLL